jgi:hypothetical protein
MPDVPEIHIDFSGLGMAIVQTLIDNMGGLGNAAWDAFTHWLYAGLRAMFLNLFSATLLIIPHALTDQFGPIQAMMPNTVLLTAMAAALSMALLGLKVLLQQAPIHNAFVDGVLGRVVKYVAVLGLLPWIVSTAITVQQQLAQSIAWTGLTSIVPESPQGPFDFTMVIALVIMIGIGVRLWFKLAANVVHIGAAVLWSPVAAVCGLLPQSDWVASLWWREFLGRLAGAVVATSVVGIGIAGALMYPGLLSIGLSGGAFIAAHDLVDWLARTPGQRMGGVLGVASDGIQAGLTATRGGVGASAGARAAGMRDLTRADAARATERFFGYD